MSEEFRVLRPQEYHSQLISKGTRCDGRKLSETRTLKLETNAIKTADSSSLVKLGNTSLVCGCKKQLESLGAKSSDVEELRIKLELPPICSGPTNYATQHTAQLLTKVIGNIIKDSKCVNYNLLVREDSDQFWSIDVEVICLNYDGSLIDAALIAILSALSTQELDGDPHMSNKLINLNSLPLSTSFAIINGIVICDPNMEEERVSQSTFSINIDTATGECCNINKVGGAAISHNDLMECIQIARTNAQAVNDILKSMNVSTANANNLNE